MTTPVDSDGTFVFRGLWPQAFKLTVKADGYQTYRQALDLSSPLVLDYHVQVFMSLAAHQMINPATEPALTDMAAPKNARKEYEEARREWKRHKPKEEQKHLERAVKDYPCYARAQTVLADLDRTEKQFANAEARYRKAIRCDGTFLRARHRLADLYLEENRPAESVSVLLEAQRVAPQDWLGLYELGAAYFAMSHYAKAAGDFLAAQSLHPKMPPPFHIRLADAYLQTGQNSKALAEIDAYLRLSPDGRYATRARKMEAVLRDQGVTEPTVPASAPSTTSH